MKKKLLSIVLVLALCFCLMPLTALAEGDGSVTHICEDVNGDHYCDSEECGEYLVEECVDEDGDHVCDVCFTVIPGMCKDESPVDHYCDTEECGTIVSDCEDTEGDDNICDICGEGIYPSASELNVEDTVGDGTITITWSALESVGTDDVASYTVYCYEDGGDIANAVTKTYDADEAPFEHTFTDLTNNVTYSAGVTVSYTELQYGEGSQFEATMEITATPFAEIWVGDVKVEEDNAYDVLGDDDEGETVTYDAESNTLTLNGADITSGYAYKEGHIAGIYTKGDLNIEVVGSDNKIAAPEAVMSRGIRANTLTITGDGILIVSGGDAAATDEDAESVGIYVTGGISIYDASVAASGGSAVVSGDGSAYSNGIYTEGDVNVNFEGALTASGGEASGKNAYSTGIDAYGSDENYINIGVYEDSYAEFVGGNTVGEEYSGSCGIYGNWYGLYVYDNSTYVTLKGGDAESTGESETAYAYSNGIMVYAGDVEINGGTVEISSGKWSGIRGDGYALYAVSEENEDENGKTFSGGNVSIVCEDVTVSKNSPSFVGTKVTIASESGEAVRAQMDFNVGDTLTISDPEGAEVKGIGGSDDPENWIDPKYWTVVNEDGTEADNVYIEPLGYTVLIKGLTNTLEVNVPAGKSINEAYCDIFGITDFSEFLTTEKKGYTFKGWYTDEECTKGCEYPGFDTPVNEDITIYAKWNKKSSSGGGGGGVISSNVTVETKTNEDGSTTTTTTNKKTGEVSETTKTTDNVTGTVVTDKNGNVTEVSAKVPAAASDEAKNGDAVTIPVEIDASDKTEDAVEIYVDVSDGGAKVEIPVKDVTPGTVAVIVNSDGTEEIVKTSTLSDNGVMLTLKKDTAVKVIDNSKHFVDVHPVNHWAENAVDFVSARGLINGYGDNYFGPDDNLSRGMLAQILYNLEGCPDVDGEMIFDDVTEDMYYYDAVKWASENGIVSGYGDGIFAPDDKITRQQLATMLYRYEQYMGGGFAGTWMFRMEYTDLADIAEWAYEPLCWMTMHDVMSGYGNGLLAPNDNATRAQAAQMLMNYLHNRDN